MSGSVLAIDTWAFAELVQEGPLAAEVTAALDAAEFLFTTREVVAETFSFIARRAGGTRYAMAWWNDLRQSDLRVFEPPLDQIHDYAVKTRSVGTLSFPHLSLACVAAREKASGVVTGDAEFRRVGLEPLFAVR